MKMSEEQLAYFKLLKFMKLHASERGENPSVQEYDEGIRECHVSVIVLYSSFILYVNDLHQRAPF